MVRNCRASMVVFPSTVVEIRVLPVISLLCWRSVPLLFELGNIPCCASVWLGPRKLRLVGVARRRLTGLDQTVDGVFLKNPHERGCLRSSMLGHMARCCKRRRHLFVMIFGNKDVKLLQRIHVSSLWPCGMDAGQNVHIS